MLFLEKFKTKRAIYLRKTYILISITLIVFLSRNISRINNEYKNYGYNPIKNTNFQFIGGDEDFYFRYNHIIKKKMNNYKELNFLGTSKVIIGDN